MDSMKVFWSKLAKGAFLALGIPYGIAIIANVMSGWPCSQEGEGKYKRALRPSRVLKVTYAVVQQMNLVTFLPVYLRSTSFHKTANNVVKNIKYGVNDNGLDVWTPYPRITAHEQDAPSATNSLVLGGAQLSRQQRPVVMFVYGGAWMSGDRSMYALLAQQLMSHLGAVVVIPNYSTHPKGEVKAMVQDLHDTLTFIRSHDFLRLAPDADPQRVLLFGHSAGAHLCALSTIDLAEWAGEGSVSAKGSESSSGLGGRGRDAESSNSSAADGDPPSTHNQDNHSGETHATRAAAKELLSTVRGVVGLGGVYHIGDHYQHEAERGVEDLSAMWRVMHGPVNFDLYSPTGRVHNMSQDEIERLPPFLLIHGTLDYVVPPSSTEKFTSALADRNVDVTQRMIAEGGHAALIMDLMDDQGTYHDAVLNGILQFGESVLK